MQSATALSMTRLLRKTTMMDNHFKYSTAIYRVSIVFLMNFVLLETSLNQVMAFDEAEYYGEFIMTRSMAQKLREFRNENPNINSSDHRNKESETKNTQLPKRACAPRKTLKQQSNNIHVQIIQRVNKYDAIINSASKKYNLPPELIKAVIKVESNFQEHAVSPKGAQSLMQLMPSTAKGLGISDPFNPRQNIYGGSMLLKQHLTEYGSLKKALIAYNAGPRWTERIQIPKETRNYIQKVIYYYCYYQKSN